jgi:hypothetical protein
MRCIRFNRQPKRLRHTCFLDASERIHRIQPVLAVLFWPSVLALLVMPVMPTGTPHPGLDAVIVCLSTAIVILRRNKDFNANFMTRGLAKAGDFSYSLYLVHWPIFALMNNVYVKTPPFGVRLFAVALALLLGQLLYRYVELPARYAEIRFSRKLMGATLAASFMLGLVPYSMSFAHAPGIDYAQIRQVNYGFGAPCEYMQNFTPKEACRNSDKPAILVWGDSFAMHLVPGIASTTQVGVIQATRSTCGPFYQLAPFENVMYTRAWAEQCLAFSQSVIDYVAATASIKVVVLSSPFTQFLSASNGDDDKSWRVLEKIDGNLFERTPTVAGAVEAMRITVDKLRSLGKRVVIVAPPPASGFDVGRCLERKATGQLILGMKSDCNIPVDDYHKKQILVLDFLKQVQSEFVPVVYLDGILCSVSTCVTSIDGIFVYRDWGHLSNRGSRMVAKKIELGESLRTVAR